MVIDALPIDPTIHILTITPLSTQLQLSHYVYIRCRSKNTVFIQFFETF